MPESQKILVRGTSGDLWLISDDTIPQKVHSQDPNFQPQDPALVSILTATDNNLADHFGSTNPGVKLAMTVLEDF
jgi:hypothetical protein